MTRILAASDIHGERKAVEDLVKKAEQNKVDLVVLCGDILLSDYDTDKMIGIFADKGIETLIIPGNHETQATIDFLAALYKPTIKSVHGKTHIKNDVAFFGCGSGNIGLFQLDEDYIKTLLKNGHDKIKTCKKKVMITHTPPYNTTIDNLGLPVGSVSVREIIEEVQPDFCLCGHIHETSGLEDKIGKTKIINVGKKGVIIDL